MADRVSRSGVGTHAWHEFDQGALESQVRGRVAEDVHHHSVGAHEQPRYYEVLKAFERRTGVPVLVNTSFNSRGEPVVCTPRDALESFWSTPLDALAIGSFIIEKSP